MIQFADVGLKSAGRESILRPYLRDPHYLPRRSLEYETIAALGVALVMVRAPREKSKADVKEDSVAHLTPEMAV